MSQNVRLQRRSTPILTLSSLLSPNRFTPRERWIRLSFFFSWPWSANWQDNLNWFNKACVLSTLYTWNCFWYIVHLCPCVCLSGIPVSVFFFIWCPSVASFNSCRVQSTHCTPTPKKLCRRGVSTGLIPFPVWLQIPQRAQVCSETGARRFLVCY